MVFDMPPHNNKEIPLYFLRKMYAEFMLGKHVNYFDILAFQGIGGGMPQNRPNARLRDVDRPIPAPRRQLPGPDVPSVHHVIPQTREAFFSLARAVVRHSTMVQHMGEEGTSVPGVVHTLGPHGAGPSSSAIPPTGAGPSIAAPSAHSQPSFEPHECTSCGRPCYGISSNVVFSGFLSDVCIWLIVINSSFIFLFVHICIV